MKKTIKKFFDFFGVKITKKLSGEEISKLQQQYIIAEAQKKFGSITSLIKVNKIVDVGSNEGQFASSCELVIENAEFYCFEPLKDVFTLLSNKYSSNPRFKLFNCGLGKNIGSTIINRNEYSPSSSILEMNNIHKQNFDFAKFTSIQEIQLQKLDTFLYDIKPDQFTLLKIDVQGYEFEVIEGGESFIKEVGAIIIEMSFQELYINQPLFNDIYIKLYSLGFKYYGNIEQLYSPLNNQILQADCLFIKK